MLVSSWNVTVVTEKATCPCNNNCGRTSNQIWAVYLQNVSLGHWKRTQLQRYDDDDEEMETRKKVTPCFCLIPLLIASEESGAKSCIICSDIAIYCRFTASSFIRWMAICSGNLPRRIARRRDDFREQGWIYQPFNVLVYIKVHHYPKSFISCPFLSVSSWVLH